ncbi:cupin-like domain-containing protein [Microbulbifer discodermiae]|uniref:cupin-like domain-containing protein n=1 Tax=Microbulbifer sp. 2201CG32-9 TaxID=3232309 RepID=UPI00345B96BC
MDTRGEDLFADLPPVVEVDKLPADSIAGKIRGLSQPLVIRDFCAHWPAVVAGRAAPRQAADYLRGHYKGVPVSACYGAPETGGRVFYNEELSGFNYRSVREDLNRVLDDILACAHSEKPPMIYMASTDVGHWFPGFAAENDAGISQLNPTGFLWLGNRVRIAAHYDLPDNLACVIAGRRRFTLFPPEQIANLYPGPLEFAPGGQEISLVDLHNPDFERFPRFQEALASAQVAELHPGDALFLPGMWWHHVESLDSFNLLYTQWWRDSPAYMGRPMNALLHGILSIRDLPERQRDAWKALLDYYVFDANGADHIAEPARGVQSRPLSELQARRLRAELLNRLKR